MTYQSYDMSVGAIDVVTNQIMSDFSNIDANTNTGVNLRPGKSPIVSVLGVGLLRAFVIGMLSFWGWCVKDRLIAKADTDSSVSPEPRILLERFDPRIVGFGITDNGDKRFSEYPRVTADGVK